MFIGHFAVGLAAKKAAPRVSLGTMFLACQLLDLIWPVLVLAGVELVHVDHAATSFTPLAFDSYPWSHSLGMAVVWSLLAFGVLKALKCTRAEAAAVAAVVFSHWVLDFVTHRPDLPLWLGDGTKVGLGLWSSVPATLAIELAVFGAGGLDVSAADTGRRPQGALGILGADRISASGLPGRRAWADARGGHAAGRDRRTRARILVRDCLGLVGGQAPFGLAVESRA